MSFLLPKFGFSLEVETLKVESIREVSLVPHEILLLSRPICPEQISVFRHKVAYTQTRSPD